MDGFVIHAQIVFPIYSCLDAMALGIVCFEVKHNCKRIYERWRAKNMGYIVESRKPQVEQSLRVEMEENEECNTPPEEGEAGCSTTDELNQPQCSSHSTQESGSTIDERIAPSVIRSYLEARQDSIIHSQGYQTL